MSPLQDSVFSFPRSSVGADGGLTTTGDLFNSTPGQSSIPLWLSSITRKPDLGTYFAVDQENHLYQIDPKFTGEQAEILKLDASNCPFAVPNCQAPAWMQAISAGYGKQLFGVDIEGRIYALGEGLPIPLATYIPAYMASFVYY